MLYQLSYRGRQPRDCSRAFRAAPREDGERRIAESGRMRRFAVVGVAVSIGVLAFAPSGLAASARVAALQVGLRAHGFDPGPVDGVRGRLTTHALLAFQRKHGIRATGLVGRATRHALGARGRPLLGQRELGIGAVGWDVAVLEFRLRRYGLGARAVDGRFTRRTGVALRRYQIGGARPRTVSPVRGRIARSRAAAPAPTLARRRSRARASSRSPPATT